MSDSTESYSSAHGLWLRCPQSRRPLSPVIVNLAELNTSSIPPNTAPALEIDQLSTPIQSRAYSAPEMTRNMSVSTDGGLPVHDESTAPIGAPTGPSNPAGTRNSTSSVKHLTCFWWKEKGNCRLNDEDCLYAHYDTGHYTDAPRQLIPGEPAMAGRRLDRAMRGLTITSPRSANSLSCLNPARQASRSLTPGLNANVAPGDPSHPSSYLSPLSLPPQTNHEQEYTRLSDDNKFLRTIVDQNGKEKAILISTIEALQEDNKVMKGELQGLRKAQDQLLAEREGLHNRIQQLEGGQVQTVAGARSLSNPFGAVGRARVNTETRFLGGLLTEE